MRWPKQRVFLSLFAFLVLSVPLFSLTGDTFTDKVVGVSDGDTISVMVGGQGRESPPARDRLPGEEAVLCTRAKQFTSDFAFGKEVTVRIQTTDRYGRTVAVVNLPDGKNLKWELVSAGLAWWYRKYAPDDRILERLEAGVREVERGLWADKNPIPPWEWRKMQRGRRGK